MTSTDRGSAADAKLPEAVITEEMISAMRSRIGIELRIDHSINNEEATRIAVAKFAGGIGDINPLWTDVERGNAAGYGGPVAPPSFVISCFSGVQFGWPGLGAFHSATQARFHRPIYWNDKISSRCRYDGFEGPRPSTFAGRAVTDSFVNTYTNQLGEVVCELNWQCINYERASAGVRARTSTAAKNPVALPIPWSSEEAEEFERRALCELPRGAVPRYWEDVKVGQPLDPLTKGPIGLTDEVAFLVGGGAPVPRLKAHAAALVDYTAHPNWSFRDPELRSSEPIYAVHYNKAAARAMGVAFPYDVGFQRQCWQIQLLTNWCGDNGWVREVSAQYRGFVYLSDVITFGGEVTAKRVAEDGERVVDVKTFARNHRGEEVMPGTAVVALPTRSQTDTTPAERRARAQTHSR